MNVWRHSAGSKRNTVRAGGEILWLVSVVRKGRSCARGASFRRGGRTKTTPVENDGGDASKQSRLR